MKFFSWMFLVILLFIVVFGGGALIWYLGDTAEFSKKSAPESTATPPAQP